MIVIILQSILLGSGLAMDACAVSMANGLKESKMKIIKVFFIALIFALFQGIMPLIGYFIGSATLTKISWIIPFLGLTLLSIIGSRMINEGVRKQEEENHKELTIKVILIQAIATSIDALTVGFTISDYNLSQAFLTISIIVLVTFIICLIGINIGKMFGVSLGNKAQICGGIILIIIGIEIFIRGVFFK